MNFLAHLWLADRAALPLAGAILGDVVRGTLPESMPAPLAASVRLHRRLDAATDRHPHVVRARRRFPPGARRYAGIVLDLLYDHALALDWARYSAESLEAFAQRAGEDVAHADAWFAHAGARAPRAEPFAQLLLSYREAAGIELAARRTAARLRDPAGLIGAMADWHAHWPDLRSALPTLLEDLAHVHLDQGGKTKV